MRSNQLCCLTVVVCIIAGGSSTDRAGLYLRRCVLAAMLIILATPGCAPALHPSGSACLPELAPKGTRILVFYGIEGPPYHGSIPKGLAAIHELGRQHRFAVDETEDPRAFSPRRLRKYDAVVFLNTIGNVLNEDQQSAFQQYIRAGGGFVGVHAAAHTEYDWEWYGRLVGAYHKRDTGPWSAIIVRVTSGHLSTRCMPSRWRISDEIYDYGTVPAPGVTILATVDEKSYQFGGMGDYHPIAWAHEFEGGRAWYTGLGHREEVYSDSVYLDHLAGGILWASGR
jgi:type 1 glutamine amidotransferase